MLKINKENPLQQQKKVATSIKKFSKTNLIKIKLIKLSYQTKSVYFFKVTLITKDILHFQQFISIANVK